ncbi:MAG: GIY-YIG nuclease family protein [Bacteroidales bacterium]
MNTKKENKDLYRQMKFRAGIFMIKNLKNNKIYLQTSTDMDRAYNSDVFKLKAGLHSNKAMQDDWNTSGADSFAFDLCDELKIKEAATESEIKSDLIELLELHRIEFLENGNILY